MRARSFSHVGITVSDFDRFVQFYADVFGCRLVAVGDSDPARVRTFFGVQAKRADAPVSGGDGAAGADDGGPRCRIGWLRAPGGGMLEIFHFVPTREDGGEVVWNRPGPTHISFDVRDSHRWHDYLASRGVEIVSPVEKSRHGHTFFFVKDCDGNLIELIDLRYRYGLLRWMGWLAGWLFKRGMYRGHYEPSNDRVDPTPAVAVAPRAAHPAA